MAQRFHVNCELAVGPVYLRGAEAHYLATVCRIRPGESVRLFNGDGHEYPGRVAEVTKRDVCIEVLGVESPVRELPFTLHVAAVLPKGDRGQFLIEKLTELGVTRCTLLVTARAVAPAREARLDRLERHVIEACKQCGRNVLMGIDGPRPWDEFLRDATLPAQRLIAHPGGETRIEPGGAVVAIGPEGGFTDEEVAHAVAAGWRAVGLGPRILRVETAALAVAARLSG